MESLADAAARLEELYHVLRPLVTMNQFDAPWGRQLRRYTAAREASNKKSIELMKNWLTPKQLEEYQQTGAFEVIGNHTGTHYRIHNASPYNVIELDRGVRRRRLCFVPDNANAPGDVMLAQKIMLETNERQALKVANHQSA